MRVFVALAVGYVIGARAGSRDMDEVVRAVNALRESPEVADLMSAVRSHVGHTLHEVAAILERKEPVAEGSGPTAPRSIGHVDDVIERVSHLFERR